MDAQALREHLERDGFRLSVMSDGLRVEPASALTTETRQLIRAHRDALMGLVRFSPAPAAFWRFRVEYPDGRAFEARTLPEATEAKARELWPGAAVGAIGKPLTGRAATEGEARELRYLLGLALEFDHPDYPEALAAALESADAHLMGLRADARARGAL